MFVCSEVYAATCSCAGVPLLNSMDTSSADDGVTYLNITYENHEISDLVSGSKEVSDETRRDRRTQSFLLELSHGITQTWAVSGMLSAVKHERKIGISSLGNESASGLGDGIVLLKYTPTRITPISRNEVSFGFGIRIPLGENEAGGAVPLSEDMQPGTGAWAGVLWGSYARAFHSSAKLQAISTFNYSANQSNDRDYTFGDELNVAIGLAYQSESNFAYGSLFRYRRVKADDRDGAKIPNTGGEWVDFAPSIQYSLSQKMGVRLSGRIPVYRDLNGPLQFTTSFSYAVTLSYRL